MPGELLRPRGEVIEAETIGGLLKWGARRGSEVAAKRKARRDAARSVRMRDAPLENSERTPMDASVIRARWCIRPASIAEARQATLGTGWGQPAAVVSSHGLRHIQSAVGEGSCIKRGSKEASGSVLSPACPGGVPDLSRRHFEGHDQKAAEAPVPG